MAVLGMATALGGRRRTRRKHRGGAPSYVPLGGEQGTGGSWTSAPEKPTYNDGGVRRGTVGGGYFGAGGIDPGSFPGVGGARKTRRAELKAMSVGTLRKMLKKLGLKSTGVKTTLVNRLNYAPRLKGGAPHPVNFGHDSHGYDGAGYRGALAQA